MVQSQSVARTKGFEQYNYSIHGKFVKFYFKSFICQV